MHPQQVQAIVAMIDGLAGQLGALRQMMAGSLPPRRPQPQQDPQYLNAQEEQLLDQAVGVPPPQFQQQPGWGAPPPGYPPQQYPQQPQWQPQMPPQAPFQGYMQLMQAQDANGYYPPPQPPQPPQRPYHTPNNMGQQPAVDFGALAPQSMAPNQRAISEMFRAAAAQGAPLDPNQMG